jgi:hypothetical protein
MAVRRSIAEAAITGIDLIFFQKRIRDESALAMAAKS